MADVDLQKELVKINQKTAERVVNEVKSGIEWILLEETGSVETRYSRDVGKSDWSKWWTGSNITVKSDYKVIYSVPVDKLELSAKDGNVSVKYKKRGYQGKVIRMD